MMFLLHMNVEKDTYFNMCNFPVTINILPENPRESDLDRKNWFWAPTSLS